MSVSLTSPVVGKGSPYIFRAPDESVRTKHLVSRTPSSTDQVMGEAGHFFQYMNADQVMVVRMANSMKLFVRGGMIAYGAWRHRWRATPQEAAIILQEFKVGNPRSTAPNR